MIEEQATVIDREREYVWVQTQRQSSCGQCSVKSGCGTQLFTKVLGAKTAYVRCLNSHDLKIGDRVIIGIEESALLSGSFLMYFFPLMSMIFFGALAVFAAEYWWPEWIDLLSVAASFSGLILGLFMAQKFVKRQSTHKYNQRACYEPVILKKLPQTDWKLKPLV